VAQSRRAGGAGAGAPRARAGLPRRCGSCPFSQLADALRTTPLRFSLCAPPIPDAPDWRTGDLNALTTTLQHAYQSLASEDEVRAAVEHLKQGVNLLAEAIYAMQVPDARLAEPLGIDARAVDPNQTEQTTAVRQIAALVLLNAMLFHEELTRVEPRVKHAPSLPRNRLDARRAAAAVETHPRRD
jgi:hypothetical protein